LEKSQTQALDRACVFLEQFFFSPDFPKITRLLSDVGNIRILEYSAEISGNSRGESLFRGKGIPGGPGLDTKVTSMCGYNF